MMKKLKTLSKDELGKIVQDSYSAAEVCKKLGYCATGSSNTAIRKALLAMQIDISHWTGQLWSKGKTCLDDARISKLVNINEIFVENSKSSAGYVRSLIKKKEIFPYVCKVCNMLPFWQNKPITLQLDHVNGNRTDQRLENLRWLCPNCHSQTATYGGQNKKGKPCVDDITLISALEASKNIWQALLSVDLGNGRNVKRAKKLITNHDVEVGSHLPKKENEVKNQKASKNYFCSDCFCKIKKGTKRCPSCHKAASHKITWPSNEELSSLLWSFPSSKIAKDLGVSDSAIGKRCKQLNITKPPRGYWEKLYHAK